MRLRNPRLGGWNSPQPWLPEPPLAAQDPGALQRVTVERRQTQRHGGKLHLHYNNTNENKSSGADISKNKTTGSHRLQRKPHRKRISASQPFREANSTKIRQQTPWIGIVYCDGLRPGTLCCSPAMLAPGQNVSSRGTKIKEPIRY